MNVVELFGGGGGMAEAMRLVGLRAIGLELDPVACETRYQAGHPTWQVDVTTVDPRAFQGVEGIAASPPCPDFSKQGARAGRLGETGRLIDLVPVWVAAIEPEWVVCEQVPEALPVWKEHGERYREMGYSVWRGVLNAADYGVPQSRERAILIATKRIAMPPDPTHRNIAGETFFGRIHPWVTASSVLGDVVVDTRCDQREDGTTQTFDATKRPAPTLTTKSMGQWKPRLSTRQALELQTFRPDYPIQGNRTQRARQIGNAVPPLFGVAILRAVLERSTP